MKDSEIRLFILNPGSATEPVHGRLINVTLGHAPQYDALSYAWGNPADVESILVNATSMGVTHNLESALRHLRNQDLPRILWIDALCINQYDQQEKSNQVSIMQSIYANAAQVVIWLGTETEHSSTGMDILAHLANGPSPECKPPWETQAPMLLQAGLADIMGRSYWQRFWVVQEVAVSQKVVVICGNRMVSWAADHARVRRFQRDIKLAEVSPQWAECGLSTTNMGHLVGLLVLQQKRLARKSYIVPDMLDIAHELRHRRTSDPRDRFFAVRGLMEDLQPGDFEPDYSESVEETYERFRKYLSVPVNEECGLSVDCQDF